MQHRRTLQCLFLPPLRAGLQPPSWHVRQKPTASAAGTYVSNKPDLPAAPQFDGDRDAAVARLLEVVSGGNFELGLIESFGGIKQTDAAVYIAKGVLAVATGAAIQQLWEGSGKQQGSYVGTCDASKGAAVCRFGDGVWIGPLMPMTLQLLLGQSCSQHASLASVPSPQAVTCRSNQSGSARAPPSSSHLTAKVRVGDRR